MAPEQEGLMAGHEVFNQQAIVDSHNTYKMSLQQQHPDWDLAMLDKQALIVTNTEAYQNQLKSYLGELGGDKIGHVNQEYKIKGNDLVDSYFGEFQKMIDNAVTGFGKATLDNFRRAGISALPGQTVTILDTSGLDIGKGIKYFDTYIKTNDDTLQHLQRYDLTGDQPTLTIDQAKQLLVNLGILDGRQLIADKDKDSLGVLVLPATEDIFVFNEQVEVQVDELLATPEIPAIEPIDAFQPQWITDWGMIESLSPVQLPTQEVQKEKQKPTLAAAATLITTETPMPVFVANEVPIRLDLEVPRKQNQQLEAETVFQVTSILPRPMPISVLPETQLEPEVPVFVVTSGSDSEAPTRLDLEGISKVKVETQTIDLVQVKPVTVTIFEAPMATTKQHLNVTAVNDRCCFSETVLLVDILFQNEITNVRLDQPKILEKPEITAIVFESATQQKKSTREIQVARGEKGKVEAASLTELPESADEIKVHEGRVATEEEIPIYRPSWHPVAIEDIPEWVWQGTVAGPNEIIDWSWFLVTMFYVLLNTKVLLNEKIS